MNLASTITFGQRGIIGGYLHERKRVHEEEKFKYNIIGYTSLGTFLVYKGVSEVQR